MTKRIKDNTCVLRDAITDELILKSEAWEVEVVEGIDKTKGWTKTDIQKVEISGESWDLNNRRYFSKREVEVTINGLSVLEKQYQDRYHNLVESYRDLDEKTEKKIDTLLASIAVLSGFVFLLICALVSFGIVKML